MTNLAVRRVAPFGHPGITAHVQLPQAYRSLSRPSSPLDAKASTVCLIAFDLKFVCGPAMRCGPTELRRSYARTRKQVPADRATGVDSSHPCMPTHPSLALGRAGLH